MAVIIPKGRWTVTTDGTNINLTWTIPADPSRPLIPTVYEWSANMRTELRQAIMLAETAFRERQTRYVSAYVWDYTVTAVQREATLRLRLMGEEVDE